MAYKSSYTGPQIDQAVGNALNKDTSTLSNDVNHIPASSVVKSALASQTITEFTANDTTKYTVAATGNYATSRVDAVGNICVINVSFTCVAAQADFVKLVSELVPASKANTAYGIAVATDGSGSIPLMVQGRVLYAGPGSVQGKTYHGSMTYDRNI